MGYNGCNLYLQMGYIGVITHLLTIDPNFQQDIQVGLMCEKSFSCTAFWTMMSLLAEVCAKSRDQSLGDDYVHVPGTYFFCPQFWGFNNSTLQKKAFKFQSKTGVNWGTKKKIYIYIHSIYIHSYMYIYLSTGCRGFLRVLNFGGHTFLLGTCCIKITAFCTIKVFLGVLRRFVFV